MGFWFGPRYPVVHSDSEDTLGKTRRRPRALAHHLGISLLTCAVLFVAFALFFLVGISLPIIKSIYIFHIDFATDASQPVTPVATDLRFGVWGLCAYSDLGQSECFGPMLGYTISDEILTLTGYPQLVEALEEGLLVILVLHLVAGALAFLGVFTSLFLESHGMAIASLVTSVFTIGGLAGSSIANLTTDTRSRKGALRVCALLMTVGAALMGVSGSVFLLMIGWCVASIHPPVISSVLVLTQHILDFR